MGLGPGGFRVAGEVDIQVDVAGVWWWWSGSEYMGLGRDDELTGMDHSYSYKYLSQRGTSTYTRIHVV